MGWFTCGHIDFFEVWDTIDTYDSHILPRSVINCLSCRNVHLDRNTHPFFNSFPLFNFIGRDEQKSGSLVDVDFLIESRDKGILTPI